MVLWMNNDKARKHLLDRGFVYSLRPKKRREGREPLFWKKFKKRATVFVTLVKHIEEWGELRQFVEYSGFETVTEWLGEAKGSRWLYFIFILSEEIWRDTLEGKMREVIPCRSPEELDFVKNWFNLPYDVKKHTIGCIISYGVNFWERGLW